jgi:predicted lipoprotein with Yx(FWY)xxD motif
MRSGMHKRLALPGALLALGLVAASSIGPGTAPAELGSVAASGSPVAHGAGSNGAEVKVAKTRFGRILVDGKGFALYRFTKDGRKKSRCHGDCASAWPPLTTDGAPVAGPGARERLLGRTKPSGGARQVAYKGHPLYYYVGDDAPGKVLCQDVREFGGNWNVVRRNGHRVG